VTSSPEAVGDLQALRSCWHAVAFADAVSDQPQRAVLLGQALVLWRDSAGQPHALNDVCIHRGTALSLGRVIGDELMCPYHGWRYGPTDGAWRFRSSPIRRRYPARPGSPHIAA
jgi:phenylpropionate dioxygenase-like ring-hydroxylating dioxygenase large terminal subunit